MKPTQTIKLLDTFAWVGGFHLALEQSIWKENIQCIWFSEIDKFAKQVYQEHFPDSPDLWDITKIDIDNLPDFDIVTGWFPCQDVSVAWKQSLEWWRTVLVEYLLQILEKKQPKYFVFENVKWLMSKKFDTFRESIFQRMLFAWYEMRYQVLNTKDFWLPQNRERVFMVWKLSPHKWIYQFPKWQELTTFLKDILEEEVDEKYCLSDKAVEKILYIVKPKEDTLAVQYYNKREFKENDILWTIWTWCGSWSWKQAYSIMVKNATKKGYIEWQEWDWINLSFPNSKTRRWRVTKNISSTLMCNDGNWVISEKLNIRKLTPTECCRLQWFPDNWSNDFVSNSQAYKQMWNAISVPVVEAIFDNLF